MRENLWWLASAHQPVPEILRVQEISYEFYREVKYREELEAYCQWYRTIAEENRRELQRMQGDINLLGWFYQGRR